MSFELDDQKQHPVDQALKGQQTRREGDAAERAEPTPPPAGNPDAAAAMRTMRNMNSLFGRALDRRSTGEYLLKFSNALNKIFNPEDATITSSEGGAIRLDSFRVMPFDMAEQFTSVSAAVLLLPLLQSDGLHLFAHTLLLEGSAPAPATLQDDWAGHRYEILQVTGDLWNEKFLKKVTDASIKQFSSHANIKFYDAGCSTVSQIVNPEDAQTIRQLAFYASAALSTLSVEVLKYQPRWALDLLDTRDTLDVATAFTGEPIMSACGQPRRTDIRMELSASIWEEEGAVRQPLTVVGGQMELVYSPPKRASDYGFGRREQEETQHFYPLFNITTLDTQYKMVSLELLLLGLASTAMLSDNLYWVHTFRNPQARARNRKEKDFRDIGALNYLVGGSYFDTKSANVSDEDFLDYFGTLTHRDLAYGMHVEERGELSWISQLFLNASNGDQASIDAIFDSADVLTENWFTRVFKEMGGVELVHPGDNRIILGTYRDDDGVVRDLRDIDLLHLLNLRGDSDREIALAYQDTFDQIDLPINYRIKRRIDILQDILGSNLKIDGFARQIYFDIKMIRALAAAVHKAGATINRVQAGTPYMNTRARGNDRIGRYAGSDLGSGLFNTWGGSVSGVDRGSDRLFMGRVRRY